MAIHEVSDPATPKTADYPVLLVDDDSQIYDLLNKAAKSEFPQGAFTFQNSYEAATKYLDALNGPAPRLIILDIDLKSDKSGLDLLTWIRQHQRYRFVPVIILSVMHEEDVVRDAYERGANAFTNKPFTFEEWKTYVQYLRTYWFTMASTPRL